MAYVGGRFMSLPAARHFDIVLGLDIHLVQPPVGPPLPIPHPFIGIIFDVFDYLPIVGSTVKINGLHAAKAGTMARAVPFHFPIGGVFVPPLPSHEGVVFMGSSVATTEGEPSTYGPLPVLTCQSVGIKPPGRKKARRMVAPLLPTSVVLPIPHGAPATIGGPPTISLGAVFGGVASALVLKGIGKGLKRVHASKFVRKMTKPIADRMHAMVGRLMGRAGVSRASALRDRVHRALCTLTGHPVDVATGKVITDAVDFRFPGPMPFVWERVWSSTSTYRGPLGSGWHHALDLALWQATDGILVRLPDGRHALFEVPIDGASGSWNAQERATLRLEGETFVLETSDRLRYVFGPVDASPSRSVPHVPLRVEDANGNAIVLRYDAAGLAEVLDSARRTFRLARDAAGRITAIMAPHPDRVSEMVRLVTYAYDEVGNLVSVGDVNDVPFTYGWHGHLLTSETDRLGVTFHFDWDGLDENARCTRTWGVSRSRRDLFERRLTYDVAGRVTRVQDSRGATTTYEWNALGLVTREVDANGGQTLYEWDDHARKLSEVDSLGHMQGWHYDTRGNVIEERDACGHAQRSRYGASGVLEELVDWAGASWSRRVDASGNVVEVVAPTGASTGYEVSAAGLPVRITDPLGRVTRLVWDDDGNLAEHIDASGAVTAFVNDGWGRVTERKDAEGGRTMLEWDHAGNITATTDAEGHRRRYAYDASANVTEAVDPLGRTRKFSYGPMGVLESVTEPSGARTQYRHDSEGELETVIDAMGRRWRFWRDQLGRVVQERDITGRTLSYAYDSEGRMSEMQDARGNQTRYSRDPVGRLVLKHLYDGTEERFVYDAAGRLVLALNQAAHVEWIYDQLGNVLAETQNGESVSHRYDVMGNEVERKTADGRAVRYLLDELNRLSRVAVNDDTLVHVEHDRLGREVRREMPSGVRSDRQYTRTGALLGQSVRRGHDLLLGREYSYDAAGKVSRVRDANIGERVFEHDLDGRLLSTGYPDGRLERYEFDPAGNTAAALLIGPNAIPLFRNADRRPAVVTRRTVHAEGWELVYDADGNLIEKALDGRRWIFSYDASSRLCMTVTPAGDRVHYAYDALGRRVLKDIGGERIKFRWDRRLMVSESLERRPREVREYIYALQSAQAIAVLLPNTSMVIEGDQIGLPLIGIDALGSPEWALNSNPWGQTLTSGKESEAALGPLPLRHQGQSFDPESGLCYNRFRYYDPTLRAYTQPDPLGLYGGLSTFAYANGNPLSEIDPLGLSSGPGDCGSGRGSRIFKGKIPDVEPKNLPQAIALRLAREGGQGEQRIMGKMADSPRLSALYGSGEWAKMQLVVRGDHGKKITVHWFRNLDTGVNAEYKFSHIDDAYR